MNYFVSLTDDIPLPKRVTKTALSVLFVTLVSLNSLPLVAESFELPAEVATEEETVMLIQGEVRRLTNQVEEIVAARADETIAPLSDEELLWYARTIYSETKLATEQRLVAWVIRNRVMSPYFPNTYKEVVLQRKQFSGFNENDPQYAVNISRVFESESKGWDTALAIAREVSVAKEETRPIAPTVMHFYSPNAVNYTPKWAAGREPAHRSYDPVKGYVRFAFYANIMGSNS